MVVFQVQRAPTTLTSTRISGVNHFFGCFGDVTTLSKGLDTKE
jgi:hypothetical protein